MEWLQAHLVPVISALAGVGLIGIITKLDALLRALMSLGSAVAALWRRLRHKPTGSDGSTPSSISQVGQSQQIHNERSSVANSQQAVGTRSAAIGAMSHSQIIQGDVKNYVKNYWGQERRKQRTQSRAKVQSSAMRLQRSRRSRKGTRDEAARSVGGLSPMDASGGVVEGRAIVPSILVSDATTLTDTALPAESESSLSTDTVPVLTPQEAQPRVNSESDNASANPASAIDGSDDPSNDIVSVTDTDVPTEIQRSGQESPALEVQQAIADVQSAPTSNDDANVEADITTGEGADSDMAEVQPAMPLDEHSTPSADLANDASLLTPDEVLHAIDDVTAQAHQAHVEEAPEPLWSPEGFTDQPITESLELDSSQDANADATASIAEAISETQRIVPIDEPEAIDTLSGDQAPETDQVVASSAHAFATPEVEAETDSAEEDVGAIADEWPAPAISSTLKRLRQARGLLPTDLSYDTGWVITFEADRWHTAQTDRWRYIRGIRTYLQALGMTPEDLRGCLRSLARRE